MLTGLDYETAAATQKAMRCRDCGAGLLAPHLGDGEFGIRCLKDPCHQGVARPENNIARRLAKMVQRDNSDAIEVYQDRTPAPVQAPPPMTIEAFRQRTALVKEVVGEMNEGVHFGVPFPGAKEKTLLEPGAEYLRAAFNIQWGYETTEAHEDPLGGTWGRGEYRYTVKAYQILASGDQGVSWAGSAWSEERRFQPTLRDNWSEEQKTKAIADYDWAFLRFRVRDMAIKRAFVNLIKNITGTSGYFKAAAVDQSEAASHPAGQGGVRERIRTWCEQHETAFMRRTNKQGGVWYSHKTSEGKWCNATDEQRREWEGEAVPSEPPQDVDTDTGEIRQPEESDTGDLFPPDEGPDAPPENLPNSCSSMVLLQELWAKFGWTPEKVETEVLGGQKIAAYIGGGDNSKGKMTNQLYQAWRRTAGV